MSRSLETTEGDGNGQVTGTSRSGNPVPHAGRGRPEVPTSSRDRPVWHARRPGKQTPPPSRGHGSHVRAVPS
jgi:hypothetical protein